MNGNDNNATNAPVYGPPNKPKKKRSKKTAPKAPSGPTAIPAGPAAKSKASDQPAKDFAYVLGPDAEVVREYIEGVFDNEKLCPRVPNRAGGFETGTKVWRTIDEGVVVANAAGMCFVGVCVPNWVESFNADGTPDPRCACLGWDSAPGTSNANGRAVFASRLSYLSTTLPPINTTANYIDFAANQLDNPPDTPMNKGTRIRCTAVTFRVAQVIAKDIASGQVMLVGTQNPLGGIGGGSLNGADWAALDRTNPEVVTRAYRSLPDWGEEDFVIVAVPGEQQCFEMVQLGDVATIGRNNTEAVDTQYMAYPIFHLALVGRSMTAGQQLQWTVTYTWETESAKTNSGSEDAAVALPVSQATLDLAKHYMKPYAAVAKTPNAHLLPWVETLAHTDPSAVAGLGRHPKLHPALRPSVAHGGAVTKPGGFLSKIKDLGAALISGVAKTGALSAIPVVGPALNGLANIVSSWF